MNDHQKAQDENFSQPARGTLAKEQAFGRRAGFIGFSILMHFALLFGIMMNSNLLTMIGDLGGKAGGDTRVANGIEVGSSTELVESASHDSSPDSSQVVLNDSNDSNSPVVAKAEPEKEILTPVEKAQAQAQAQTQTQAQTQAAKPKASAKKAPITPIITKTNKTESVTESAAEADAGDVAAATTDATTEDATAATTVSEAAEVTSEDASENNSGDVSNDSATETVAAANKTETASNEPLSTKTETAVAETNDAEANKAEEEKTTPPVLLAKTPEDQSETQSGTGQEDTGGQTSSGQGDGAGAGLAAVQGPIRDAGTLKALSNNPNPQYPVQDRLKRNEGTTTLLGQVTEEGKVKRVLVEKTSGSKEMDIESAKAFKDWKFESGQAGWVRKPFQFRLVGETKELPAKLGESRQTR